MKYLVVLIAVVGLIVYDYLHDKTIIAKAGAWLKYAVAAACGLLYTAITSLPFFQWLAIAAIVVLGGMFWGVISNGVVAIYNKVAKKTVPLPATTNTTTTTIKV
jgi:hypothetical protein